MDGSVYLCVSSSVPFPSPLSTLSFFFFDEAHIHLLEHAQSRAAPVIVSFSQFTPNQSNLVEEREGRKPKHTNTLSLLKQDKHIVKKTPRPHPTASLLLSSYFWCVVPPRWVRACPFELDYPAAASVSLCLRGSTFAHAHVDTNSRDIVCLLVRFPSLLPFVPSLPPSQLFPSPSVAMFRIRRRYVGTLYP